MQKYRSIVTEFISTFLHRKTGRKRHKLAVLSWRKRKLITGSNKDTNADSGQVLTRAKQESVPVQSLEDSFTIFLRREITPPPLPPPPHFSPLSLPLPAGKDPPIPLLDTAIPRDTEAQRFILHRYLEFWARASNLAFKQVTENSGSHLALKQQILKCQKFSAHSTQP